VSGRVRAAREACCDDLAVQGGAERTVVARALTALAERAVGARSRSWAPAASGGSLLRRIRRLLSPERAPSGRTQRLSVAAAVLLVVGLPLGLAACASQQSATEKGTAKQTKSNVAGSRAPDSTHRSVPMTVMRDDSTGRTMTIHADGSMHTEVKENGVFVFHLDGGKADTIDLRQEWEPSDLDSLRQQLRQSFDGQVLRMQLNPDSLKGEIQSGLDPDSLDRALRQQFDPDSFRQQLPEIERSVERVDSLARWHREHADSLRRHFEQMRERMRREMPEHLREQARRLREQAERLEERAREMEAPESPAGPGSPPSGPGNG
jgi:hypothetical protein